MRVLLNILSTVVPVFAIMALGFTYGRFRKLPSRELTDVLLWIFLPCLVLGSIGTQSFAPAEILEIGGSAFLILAGTGLCMLALSFRRPERRALLLSAMFMNSANMAFPLALFAFGEPGLGRQIVFYVAVHLLHVTLGVGIARGRGGLREVLRFPPLYAAALGLVLALTQTSLPPVVVRPLDLVGKATIPIMLLLLGERLATTRLRHVGLALLATCVRLGVGFALGLIAVSLFNLTGLSRAAVLIGSVMPAAVLNFILCEKYDLYPGLAATTVVVSTLLSIGTTPLALYFIGMG